MGSGVIRGAIPKPHESSCCFQSNEYTAKKVMLAAAAVFLFFLVTTVVTILALYIPFASKGLFTTYVVGLTVSAIAFIIASVRAYGCPSQENLSTLNLVSPPRGNSTNPFDDDST